MIPILLIIASILTGCIKPHDMTKRPMRGVFTPHFEPAETELNIVKAEAQ